MKKYVDSLKLIDRNVLYNVSDAIELVLKTSKAKFDETIEVHAKLGVDGRKAELQVRGTVMLPHGIGKEIKVLVIAKNEKLDEAKEAGADYVGGIDLIEKIQSENWFDFDTVITTPDMMSSISKIGRILGPRGLMPNPKSGTVSIDVAKAVKEVKLGRIEYKLDKTNIIHSIIGKSSFGIEKLKDNFYVLLKALIKSKPSAAKGKYLRSLTLASTMGPGIKINPNDIDV